MTARWSDPHRLLAPHLMGMRDDIRALRSVADTVARDQGLPLGA